MATLSASPATETLLIRPPEAARLLGISPRTLWSLTRTGALRHVRVGRLVRYSRAALADWVQERLANQN